MIIDSHCHVGSIWYEPAEVLLFQMDRCQVEKATLVQMLGQFDNTYQQACAARWPGRFASIVAVDPSTPSAVEDLRRLAQEGAVGVRLRPGARSPGADPLAIWRAAQAEGLAVSCVGTTAQFTQADFAAALAELPGLDVLLEHLGGVARPDADATVAQVWDLARYPNVLLKVPGLGQLARKAMPLPAGGSPFEPGGETALMRAVEAFSAARLMWGSDFPVVGSREGYAGALEGARDALQGLSAADRAEIFGGAAARVFGLRA